MSECSRIALVLGATGGIGGETALALSRRGWKIRAFSRTAKPADSSGWEWSTAGRLFQLPLQRDAYGPLVRSRTLRRVLYATRPLWETPIDLDNARLVQFLGQEPHTPLDKAVDATLRALGCLGA